MFFGGNGFTRERSLFYLQVDRFDQTRVGGYLISWNEEYDITRYEFTRRDFALTVLTYYGSHRRSHPA